MEADHTLEIPARAGVLQDRGAAEAVAKGGDVVGGARCQFANRGDAAQQFVEVLEISAQVGMKLGE